MLGCAYSGHYFGLRQNLYLVVMPIIRPAVCGAIVRIHPWIVESLRILATSSDRSCCSSLVAKEARCALHGLLALLGRAPEEPSIYVVILFSADDIPLKPQMAFNKIQNGSRESTLSARWFLEWLELVWEPNAR